MWYTKLWNNKPHYLIDSIKQGRRFKNKTFYAKYWLFIILFVENRVESFDTFNTTIARMNFQVNIAEVGLNMFQQNVVAKK